VQTYLTKSPARAAEFIRKGGIVAFPTETVYGLGADVFNDPAIKRIFEAKNRPADNPLIAHVGDLEQIVSLTSTITDHARRLIDAFFPGPLTVVLPRGGDVPFSATAGLDTIGVRMPRHEIAREFLKECGTPVVAPSANLSGRPSPTTWQAVYEDLNGRIDCVLKGEATEIGLESTVVDCTGDVPLLLRSGAISFEDLRRVVPEAKIYSPRPGEQPRSPGVTHRHYSPKARVSMIDSSDKPAHSESSGYIGVSVPSGQFGLVNVCRDSNEYARSLFEFFRECDRRGLKEIYCEAVDDEGIGRALMDRIRRAAEGS
jgi:L-threonylcarbamoyladenylate synthase